MKNVENRPRVNYYLAWARTYLKRGDALINSSRGVWALTEIGSAITRLRDTQAVYDQVNLEEREKSRAKRQANMDEKAPIDETIEAPPEEADDWKGKLLSVVGEMHPSAFERLSQRLLREAGFISASCG